MAAFGLGRRALALAASAVSRTGSVTQWSQQSLSFRYKFNSVRAAESCHQTRNLDWRITSASDPKYESQDAMCMS